MNPNLILTEELIDRVVQIAWEGRGAAPDVTLALCSAVKKQNTTISRLVRERDCARADLDQFRRSVVSYRL